MSLNGSTGIITGSVPGESKDYEIEFVAENGHGTYKRAFCLIVGDTLALTPPMGWNSWYIHYNRVTEQHMRNAADAMIESGMADAGYMYVNIDDCWMKKRGDAPYRDKDGAILPNDKFPDIKGMVDHIHSHGLRAGLYTSPGKWTCANYVGSYSREEEDARKFAKWGFDFLKYDWCSYLPRGFRKKDYARPYIKMGRLLASQERDIVYNLCQYGMKDVWEWGARTGGNSWRTTGDLGLKKGKELPGFYYIGLENAKYHEYAGPGAWNDPDYLLIGWVGDALVGMGEGKPTNLTPDEQYSYMSMWALMAAPLFFSGDMEKLDPFTLNILTNSEVIDVDQDPLGRQGHIIRHADNQLIMAKPMEDGSLSIGLFNLGEEEMRISISWKELSIDGEKTVRDLWRQKNIGAFNGKFSSIVPSHGVSLVKIY